MLARLRAGQPLRVGVHPGARPFIVEGAAAAELRARLSEARPSLPTLEGQQLAGFEVELVASAAEAIGVRLELVLVERFEDLLPGLEAGRYDLAAGTLTRTLPRGLRVAFTDPFFVSGQVLLVRSGPGLPRTLAELEASALRVGLVAGTTGAAFASSRLPRLARVAYPSLEALLAAGQAPEGPDVLVVDALTARDVALRAAAGEPPYVFLEDRRFTHEELAFAVRQGDADWVGWLNLFLRQLRSSGTFHRMAARYNAWFRMER